MRHAEANLAMTVQYLRNFEDEVTARFAAGDIKSPVHLGGGNEEHLIRIFKDIDIHNDWVLGGWRSHYHALLKGIQPEALMAEILVGHSVSLCFPEHKFFCSGIVAGSALVALGVAQAEKWKADASPYGQCAKVHVFMGDMTAEHPDVSGAIKFAEGHNLPIRWITEDNGLSVGTNTAESWGLSKDWVKPYTLHNNIRYRYELDKPHAGVGRWVNFK